MASHAAVLSESPPLVPQPHGGALRRGNPGYGHLGGRPPDSLRHALRGLTAKKGLRVLGNLLSGRIVVTFHGTCPACKTLQPLPDGPELAALHAYIREHVPAVAALQLQANEQCLKYGVGTAKEEPDYSQDPEFVRRMAGLRAALLEVCGEEMAVAVVQRAEELSR